MAANKTAYKYGDATVVVPRRLHELLSLFAERVRPFLLRGNKDNTDLLPHLNAYASGPLSSRRPDWLTPDLLQKVRGNKLRIMSVVWVSWPSPLDMPHTSAFFMRRVALLHGASGYNFNVRRCFTLDVTKVAGIYDDLVLVLL